MVCVEMVRTSSGTIQPTKPRHATWEARLASFKRQRGGQRGALMMHPSIAHCPQLYTLGCTTFGISCTSFSELLATIQGIHLHHCEDLWPSHPFKILSQSSGSNVFPFHAQVFWSTIPFSLPVPPLDLYSRSKAAPVASAMTSRISEFISAAAPCLGKRPLIIGLGPPPGPKLANRNFIFFDTFDTWRKKKNFKWRAPPAENDQSKLYFSLILIPILGRLNRKKL